MNQTDKNTDNEKATVRQKAPALENGATLGELLHKHQGQAQHSPLPWMTGSVTAGVGEVVYTHKHTICRCDWTGDKAQDEANARLIVASVNHADKLAGALRVAKDVLAERGVELKEITRALANYESEAAQ